MSSLRWENVLISDPRQEFFIYQIIHVLQVQISRDYFRFVIYSTGFVSGENNMSFFDNLKLQFYGELFSIFTSNSNLGLICLSSSPATFKENLRLL